MNELEPRIRDEEAARGAAPPSPPLGPAQSPTSPMTSGLRWAAALLFACILGLYSATFAHGFVIFDDPVYVSENETVQGGLTLEGARWAFGFHASNWHPLTWLSHMLDVELFGMEAGGHHASAVVLHGLNALLFFAALRRLSGAGWTSLLAAALFALHPLRVESVAWISERKDVLSTCFWMLTLWTYARYAERPTRKRMWLVALALGVGLMAKQMLVSLPCVLLLLDVWPLGRARWSWSVVAGEGAHRVWREKAWLFALVVGASITVFVAQRQSGAVADLDPLPPSARLANAVRSYAIYLGQALWPTNLACFYPHPTAPGMDPTRDLWIPAGLSTALLSALTFAAWRVRARAPYVLVGWLSYLGTAVPVIGLVQVGQQGHADRYTYVPLLGLAMAAAFALRAWVDARPALQRPVAGGALAVLALCAALTYRQVGTWETSRALFAHAAAVTDRNFYAHTFHGVTLRIDGELDAARAELNLARSLNPRFHRIPWELGLVERDAENFAEAARELEKAVRMDSTDPRKRSDLASVLIPLGRLEDAELHLKAGLRHEPDHTESLVNLGGIAFTRRDYAEAERLFTRASTSAPLHAKAKLELAAVHLVQGRKSQARPLVEWLEREAPETAGLDRLRRMLGKP